MGRQRNFDRQQVVDRAMRLFWAQGYDRTSIQELVDAMGISRGSLYATFGDKEQLYLTSLECYIDSSESNRRELLNSENPAHEILTAYLNSLVDFAIGEGRQLGCLVTNSSVEFSPRRGKVYQRLRQVVEGMETRFEQLIRRAQQEGDISAEKDPQTLAHFLICQIQGLRVLTRAYPEDEARLRNAVKVTLSALS